MQRLDDYLGHILEAIDRILRYTGGMEEVGFLSNQLVQDAVTRNLEVIGEASNNIEKRFPQFAAAHPELPLSAAYQMRNAVAHGYFKVDYAVVWNTLRENIPALRSVVLAARAELVRDGVDGNGPST